jgi:hypothetical protein
VSLVRVQGAAAPADRATGHRSLLPDPNREPSAYKAAADCAKEAGCARPDLNRDSPRGPPAPRAGASTHFRHERMTAATRGRTGPPAVRERGRKPCAAAWLGNQGSNLDSSGPEPDVLPDYTIPH